MTFLAELQVRSRAYGLFGRLYERGLTEDELSVVRSIDGLAGHVPARFDSDDAAADHYALFGLDVVPYAGAFLDPEGRVGGRAADTAAAFFAEAGVAVAGADESADYLPSELALLEVLLAAEAHARRGNRHEEVERIRRLQRRFMDVHLLAWLPPFLEVVSRQERGFYRDLAQLTLDLVVDHRASLGVAGEDAAAETARPDVAALLEHPRTGLKEIAAILTMPATCGLYLSRGDVDALGRAENIPRGFGSRMQTLTNLLRSAVEFDRIGGVLTRLSRLVADARAYYAAMANDGPPAVAAAADPWLERLGATDELLERLRENLPDEASARSIRDA